MTLSIAAEALGLVRVWEATKVGIDTAEFCEPGGTAVRKTGGSRKKGRPKVGKVL